jgi:hypothetical protein
VTEPAVVFDRMPAPGPITGGYGDWMFDGARTWRHRGTDIGCPTGTPVHAPAPGTVVAFTNDGSYGIGVCLRHADGWHTLYAHLSRAVVSPGNHAERGALLGYSGATGYTFGAHLHWQLCDSPAFPIAIGASRDPLNYLITEETMEAYRWALVRLSGGPFQPMLDGYEALRRGGFFAELDAIEGPAAPIDGNNDLNDALVRRLRIQWLAGGDRALDAATLLGVTV